MISVADSIAQTETLVMVDIIVMDQMTSTTIEKYPRMTPAVYPRSCPLDGELRADAIGVWQSVIVCGIRFPIPECAQEMLFARFLIRSTQSQAGDARIRVP